MTCSCVLYHLLPLPTLSSSLHLSFLKNSGQVCYLTSLTTTRLHHQSKPITLPVLAFTESSDSSQSLDPSPESLLANLSDCFDLPPDYFEQLPSDLRLDLNDAAFDLSNGPVLDECGQELGELLLNLSRAWELADTAASHALARKLPMLEGTLTSKAKAAFGKRLVSAGRRFQAVGQYGQGEMQKLLSSNFQDTLTIHKTFRRTITLVSFSFVAKAMITTGKFLSASPITATVEEEPKKETRVFKFGELQVAVTPEKANIGAVIGVAFGILSWEACKGIQNIPESSFQYANDNAVLLAKSLRGALLVLFYSSTFLSAFTSVGLFLLGRQLKSEEK